MRDQEPEAKDGLGENVEDSIGYDLAIDAKVTATLGDTPDAAERLDFGVTPTSRKDTYMG